MLNEINKLEEKLEQLYDGEVKISSKYFNNEMSKFFCIIQELHQQVPILQLLLSLYNKYELTKYDMTLLQIIIDNKGIIQISNKKLYKMIKCSSVTLWLRIVYLESEDIIKIQRYNSIKIIYLHPELLIKWKKNTGL